MLYLPLLQKAPKRATLVLVFICLCGVQSFAAGDAAAMRVQIITSSLAYVRNRHDRNRGFGNVVTHHPLNRVGNDLARFPLRILTRLF